MVVEDIPNSLAINHFKELRENLSSRMSAWTHQELKALVSRLPVSLEAVEEYVAFSDEGYARNLVEENEFYQLFIICWKGDQASQIHDHKGSSCVLQILSGAMKEVIYEVIDDKALTAKASNTNFLESGCICASYDSDVHKVLNGSPDGAGLVTMHIYSPPLKMNFYKEI